MSSLRLKMQETSHIFVDMIIRPPRARYTIQDLGLEQFMLKGVALERKDVEVVNDRGQRLQCSHFTHLPPRRGPCVVYLHGNCGSRMDGFNVVPLLCPAGIQVFCFDFSGSGLSDGDFISLGFYERDDVRAVVERLREDENVTTIGLWGRSMGAATALMYAAEDPSIAGLVLDSPFSSLRKLSRELAHSPELPVSVPTMAVDLGMKLMRKQIKKRAHFDVNHLRPIDYVDRCFSPALFAHGADDTFILPAHCQELHDGYAGEKSFQMIDGATHNSVRPSYFRDAVAIFFCNTLSPPDSAGLLDVGKCMDDGEMGAAMGLADVHDSASPFEMLNPEWQGGDPEEAALQQALLLSMQDDIMHDGHLLDMEDGGSGGGDSDSSEGELSREANGKDEGREVGEEQNPAGKEEKEEEMAEPDDRSDEEVGTDGHEEAKGAKEGWRARRRRRKEEAKAAKAKKKAEKKAKKNR